MLGYVSMKLFLVIFIIFFSATNLAESLPDLIDKTKPSIVAVGTFMPKRSPKALFLGTGFAIADGRLIVTNAHVLPKKIDAMGFEALSVYIQQNEQAKKLDVKIVAVDRVHDIAILKLLTGTLLPLELEKEKVREGQSIAFTGYPIGMVLGLYPVTHRGIVSAISPIAIPMMRSRQLNAKVLKRLRDPFEVYQLDATAYPGNSGSPVYNTETGRVIGIVNKVFVKESKETVLSKPSGITYAIPIRYLNDLLHKG